MGVVLRGSPNHCRPADVDEFFGAASSVLELGHARPEGIEVADHKIDRRNTVLGHVGLVLGIGPVGEDAAVDLRVQGDNSVAEHDR